ncbi:hypothetical protein E2C01_066337 [Portunus trituberculatus]|uniref:Uncharacterized protein n=1 Tax=Portunus trituberculatus TaxID=210409 RepID=A0A5B7HUE1_PORTR|nr:hypothetical protein [Portunus trituberculatus]
MVQSESRCWRLTPEQPHFKPSASSKKPFSVLVFGGVYPAVPHQRPSPLPVTATTTMTTFTPPHSTTISANKTSE